MRRSKLIDDSDLYLASNPTEVAVATTLVVPSLGLRTSFGATAYYPCPGLRDFHLRVRFEVVSPPFGSDPAIIDALVADESLTYVAGEGSSKPDVTVELDWRMFTQYVPNPYSLFGDFIGGSLRLDGNLFALSALEGARTLVWQPPVDETAYVAGVELIVNWGNIWSGLRIRRDLRGYRR